MDLRKLIGFQDPVAPRPVHIDEVETFARISRADFCATQYDCFSGRDTGNDSRVESGPRILDFPVSECRRDEYPHAARDDFVSRDRMFGFNHSCLKRRVIQEGLPNTKSSAATYDLVAQASRLNLQTV